MKPQWFSTENIPYDKMWLDDQYWWPYFLKNINFIGYFKYRGYDKILSYDIKATENFDWIFYTHAHIVLVQVIPYYVVVVQINNTTTDITKTRKEENNLWQHE